ncbi:inorganic triphosphatase [Thalassotalea sp. M1531]|uniref:Inorganic triphosphatase n=1 Tax=Thalassotalea algicola TaxID=2716224 RepID=A0A7Y0LD53_9GAMM|nr:CYTH domain-containing protein [Thalassotalea algicola]NMP32246.1 inorganic triphosphatase [Thalassotalea algicola]
MATEIELKYLVDDDNIVDKFTAILTKQQYSYTHNTRQLINSYFDTQDKQLRALDFGLRVRKAEDYTEQTIKTAGVVVGGLHQRPEYNVEITGCQPDLSLFPREIWPDNYNVDHLQQKLTPLFSTNFRRESWQVSIGDSVVEVAFDKGAIESKGVEIPISEIELELISGKTGAIFELAELLFESFHLSAGQLSKAARGYQLWQFGQQTTSEAMPLSQLQLNEAMSVERALIKGIEHGLNTLQDAIALTIAAPELENVKQVYLALTFIQHGLYLHHELIEDELYQGLKRQLKEAIDELSWLESAINIKHLTLKTGSYRKKLEYSQQLIQTLKIERGRFPQESEIKSLLTGKLLNTLQLNLLKFVLSPVVKPAETPRLLPEYSRQKLEQSLAEIVSISHNKMQLSPLEYLVMQHHLNRSLLTGNWFSSLYEQSGRKDYRRTWLDVLQGIEELATLDLLQKQLKALEQGASKLENWLEGKIENLLVAIEHSYQSAIRVEPYWR